MSSAEINEIEGNINIGGLDNDTVIIGGVSGVQNAVIQMRHNSIMPAARA